MRKQLSLLTISVLLLSPLSSTHLRAAAKSSAINRESCKKLYKAAESGNIACALQALNDGADIQVKIECENIRTRRNFAPATLTPLDIATRRGHLTMVRFLLSQGALVNTTRCSQTCLNALCSNKSLPRETVQALVTELLIHKAPINKRNGSTKYTPLMHAINSLQDENIVLQLILAGADITITSWDNKTAFDMIKTPSIKEAYEKALAINKQAFQQLPALEATMHARMLKNLHIPIEKLAEKFSPFYTNQGESQPAYYLLNERIAKQWSLILEKLEITRLLNQPTCLPVQSVAAIAADYLFSK